MRSVFAAWLESPIIQDPAPIVQRDCPNCSKSTIPVSGVLFSDYRCPNCRSVIGVSRFAAATVNALILIVTIVTTAMVFLQLGLYAAIVWLPLPIGSLSYLKARFCRLASDRPDHDGPR